ncbi:hypothetical protein FPRO06_10728 [Fusarium proliferatum]|nr:hypothetical protein FPRO06_10728 [Fusarium proliferatum]
MANSQLGHDQDDEEELECRREIQYWRAQPFSGCSLWLEKNELETSDSRVATPVADSDNHRKIQHRPRKAYARDDVSIYRLPEQAVNSNYDIPPSRCRAKFTAPVSPNKCANNDSPSITPRPLAKDTARTNSLPEPAPGSDSKMVQYSETWPISQEQLVAGVKAIYAGLVMIETKCTEVDKAASANSNYSSEDWQIIALHRQLMYEALDHVNIATVKALQAHDLGALLSEVSLRSQRFCRLNSRFYHFCKLEMVRLQVYDTILAGLFDLIMSIIRRLNLRFRSAYEELKCRNASTQIIFEFPNNMRHVYTTMPWTILPALLVLWGVCWMFIIGPGDLEPEKFKPPAPTFSPAPAFYDFLENPGIAYYELGLLSVPVPEPSSTGFDQHPTIDSLLFPDDGAGIDPIYLVQHVPRDPDFLSFDVLPRNSAGIVETSVKEDLTKELPAAVTPDPILQTYGDANRQEPFNQMVNVASVGQVVQNTSGDQKNISYFACPKCQQTFANSFTLNRHQTEAHKDAASSPEESFPCPNRGCKRSAKGSPFKRLYNLNRHLQICKHNPNVVTSSAQSDVTEERPLSHSISTPALPDELQPAEPPSEGSSGDSSVRKRSRPEKDNDWSEESLLREMKKKLKRMAQEVKEKEDAYLQAREGLESIQKTIQVMEDSLRKS